MPFKKRSKKRASKLAFDDEVESGGAGDELAARKPAKKKPVKPRRRVLVKPSAAPMAKPAKNKDYGDEKVMAQRRYNVEALRELRESNAARAERFKTSHQQQQSDEAIEAIEAIEATDSSGESFVSKSSADAILAGEKALEIVESKESESDFGGDFVALVPQTEAKKTEAPSVSHESMRDELEEAVLGDEHLSIREHYKPDAELARKEKFRGFAKSIDVMEDEEASTVSGAPTRSVVGAGEHLFASSAQVMERVRRRVSVLQQRVAMHAHESKEVEDNKAARERDMSAAEQKLNEAAEKYEFFAETRSLMAAVDDFVSHRQPLLQGALEQQHEMRESFGKDFRRVQGERMCALRRRRGTQLGEWDTPVSVPVTVPAAPTPAAAPVYAHNVQYMQGYNTPLPPFQQQQQEKQQQEKQQQREKQQQVHDETDVVARYRRAIKQHGEEHLQALLSDADARFGRIGSEGAIGTLVRVLSEWRRRFAESYKDAFIGEEVPRVLRLLVETQCALFTARVSASLPWFAGDLTSARTAEEQRRWSFLDMPWYAELLQLATPLEDRDTLVPRLVARLLTPVLRDVARADLCLLSEANCRTVSSLLHDWRLHVAHMPAEIGGDSGADLVSRMSTDVEQSLRRQLADLSHRETAVGHGASASVVMVDLTDVPTPLTMQSEQSRFHAQRVWNALVATRSLGHVRRFRVLSASVCDGLLRQLLDEHVAPVLTRLALSGDPRARELACRMAPDVVRAIGDYERESERVPATLLAGARQAVFVTRRFLVDAADQALVAAFVSRR